MPMRELQEVQTVLYVEGRCMTKPPTQPDLTTWDNGALLLRLSSVSTRTDSIRVKTEILRRLAERDALAERLDARNDHHETLLTGYVENNNAKQAEIDELRERLAKTDEQFVEMRERWRGAMDYGDERMAKIEAIVGEHRACWPLGSLLHDLRTLFPEKVKT